GTIDIGAVEVQIGAATRLVLSAPASVTSGTPFDVTVTALDAYGHTATGYTGTVTFSTTDPDPGVVLPADYPFTADDQGTHTFSGGSPLLTPGAQSLTAPDAAGGLSGSVPVTVTSGGGGGGGGGRSEFAPGRSVPAHRSSPMDLPEPLTRLDPAVVDLLA